MPVDMPVLDEDQLTAFVRLPRSARRAISRDLAREHPIPPKRRQYGAVGRWLNRGLPPKRSPRVCPAEEMRRDRAQRVGRVEPRIVPAS
jgi:hypothetical protein